jgi:hypothetical protein
MQSENHMVSRSGVNRSGVSRNGASIRSGGSEHPSAHNRAWSGNAQLAPAPALCCDCSGSRAEAPLFL